MILCYGRQMKGYVKGLDEISRYIKLDKLNFIFSCKYLPFFQMFVQRMLFNIGVCLTQKVLYQKVSNFCIESFWYYVHWFIRAITSICLSFRSFVPLNLFNHLFSPSVYGTIYEMTNELHNTTTRLIKLENPFSNRQS